MSGYLIGPSGVVPPAGSPNLIMLDASAQSNGGGTVSSWNVTTASTTGSSNIFVLTTWLPASTVTVLTVSIAGSVLSCLPRAFSTGNNMELWTATANAPISSHAVTITLSAAVSFPSVGVASFSGVNIASPFDGSALTGSTAQSITTTNANDVILGFMSTSGNAPVKGTQFQDLYNTADFNFGEYKIVTSPQTSLLVDLSSDTIINTIVQAVKSA